MFPPPVQHWQFWWRLDQRQAYGEHSGSLPGGLGGEMLFPLLRLDRPVMGYLTASVPS